MCIEDPKLKTTAVFLFIYFFLASLSSLNGAAGMGWRHRKEVVVVVVVGLRVKSVEICQISFILFYFFCTCNRTKEQ